MAALDRWGDPSPIMGQELSFCGKLWRKVFGLVRSYDTAQRQADSQDEGIQAADEESEDADELSNIGDDDNDDSDQSDYASDPDD